MSAFVLGSVSVGGFLVWAVWWARECNAMALSDALWHFVKTLEE